MAKSNKANGMQKYRLNKFIVSEVLVNTLFLFSLLLETTLGRQDEGTVTEVPNTLATL
jgi:hypothetical protein